MHPAIDEFQRYWDQLKGDATAPLKSAFSVSQLRGKLWKYLALVEVERAPMRFKYVVFGRAHTESYGADLTGQYLDEIDVGDKSEEYQQQFEQVTTTQQPLFVRDEYRKEDGAHYSFEGGCFPLLGDDGQVSHLVLVVASYRNGVSYMPW